MVRPAASLSVVAALAVLASPALAQDNSLWIEATQGDMSDDWLNPTQATLGAGSNIVSGTSGDFGTGGVDRDYITITIPAGLELVQILHTDYFSTDLIAFLGVQPGPTMPDPDLVTSTSLLGWTLFGPTSVGTDMFDNLSIPRFPGGGLQSPVGPGVYTFWIQQTGEETLYEFDFVTIPSPAGAGLLAMAGLASLRRRR